LEDINLLRKINYFQFFCLEPRYDLDMKTLNMQFKQYQRFIHPDKFEMA
jgi:molecular chaperone HscB